MPLIRCQWFDDNRQPIDRGCRWESTTCEFIHPSSHLWGSAVRKKTAIPRMGPRKGPSGWSDAPRRDRNANTTGLGARGHSIKSPPTGPASERTSWDTGQWYKNSQKSGQSDAGPSTSTQAGASATTWGTTTDWAKSPPQGADKIQGTGFASPGWGGTKDSEGTWGSTGWDSAGKDNAPTGTWGSSGWGTSDAGIGLENVPAEEPQPMQVDSESPSTSKCNEKEIPRRDSQNTTMLPPLLDPTTTSSHISLPKKRKDPGKQPVASLTVDVSGSGSGPSDQPHSPSHLLTDAQNVYKEVMKLFFTLVRLKIEKSEHEEKHRAWSSAQSSQPYAMGQDAAGSHWNQAQKELDTIHDINRNIEETLKKLLSLPDVSTPKISLDEMEEKMECITKFTKDVDLWMKQLAEAQDKAERKAAEAAAENYPIDITPRWKPKAWPENPTLEYFQKRIAELQDQVNDLSDFLEHKKSMDNVDSLFEEGIQMSDSLARLRMEELDPEEDSLTLRLDNAGGQVVEMMSTIAEYTGKFVNQKDELERWKSKRDHNLAVKAELEEKIAGFEKRSKERRSRLQEKSDELRELRQMEQAYPPQLINPLLEQIANEVIEKEVEPVLAALRTACEAASTQSVDKMTQKLEVAAQPMVESNHRLREQARRSRASTSS